MALKNDTKFLLQAGLQTHAMGLRAIEEGHSSAICQSAHQGAARTTKTPSICSRSLTFSHCECASKFCMCTFFPLMLLSDLHPCSFWPQETEKNEKLLVLHWHGTGELHAQISNSHSLLLITYCLEANSPQVLRSLSTAADQI